MIENFGKFYVWMGALELLLSSMRGHTFVQLDEVQIFPFDSFWTPRAELSFPQAPEAGRHLVGVRVHGLSSLCSVEGPQCKLVISVRSSKMTPILCNS